MYMKESTELCTSSPRVFCNQNGKSFPFHPKPLEIVSAFKTSSIVPTNVCSGSTFKVCVVIGYMGLSRFKIYFVCMRQKSVN